MVDMGIRPRAFSEEEIARLNHAAVNTYNRTEANNALILLSDEGSIDPPPNISKISSIPNETKEAVRLAFQNHGLEAALKRKERGDATRIPGITGDFEARLLCLACESSATLRSLSDVTVKDKLIDSISTSTVWQILNSNEVKPHMFSDLQSNGFRDESNMRQLREVLGYYRLPYNIDLPIICQADKPFSLLARRHSVARSAPLSKNPLETFDKYDVNPASGDPSIYMYTEPLTGWCKAVAKESSDISNMGSDLLEIRVRFGTSENIRLVINDLDTTKDTPVFQKVKKITTAAMLYNTYRFIIMPECGSWLNIAECELARAFRECLSDLKSPSVDEINERLAIWIADRHKSLLGINWQRKVNNKIELYRLYPERVMASDAPKFRTC
ncbi:MAG: hypothetical protein LBT59_16535 [Clostridiales bacterium]|jgi:hypothetical protein|nr:hypothetical protein [Clostridiales bacterium]